MTGVHVIWYHPLFKDTLPSHKLLLLLVTITHCHSLLVRIALGLWEPPHRGGDLHLPPQPPVMTAYMGQNAMGWLTPKGRTTFWYHLCFRASPGNRARLYPGPHSCLTFPPPQPAALTPLEVSPSEHSLSKAHAHDSVVIPAAGEPSLSQCTSAGAHTRVHTELEPRPHTQRLPLFCSLLCARPTLSGDFITFLLIGMTYSLKTNDLWDPRGNN